SRCRMSPLTRWIPRATARANSSTAFSGPNRCWCRPTTPTSSTAHRSSDRKQMQDVSPYPLDTSGNGAGELKYRFQWTEPVLVSAYDSNVIYSASQFVLKSADQGRSWN